MIAECSKGSILQYFRPSLSYHLSLRSLLCLFLSGRFTQVPFQGGTSFGDHLCFLCLVFLMFLMLSRLFIAALWSPAEKGLTSWLLLVMCLVFFVTFPCGILGQVWYLIVWFPDLCHLSYFTVHCI